MRFQAEISFMTAISTLSSFAMAFPSNNTALRRSALTAPQLESIAPTSNSCAGATHPSECRTAVQALPFISQSFSTYSITSAGAQAAIVSTIAFESGDFKYQVHYFPSPIPGQGTRNMQSVAYNLLYAKSIPSLAGKIATAQQTPNGVLNLLISKDEWDFASAAWFLDTQCGQSVKTALAEGGMNGFMAYLGCLGTDMDDGRQHYWQRATAAFGVQSSA